MKLRVEILGKVGPIQKPTFEIIRELPYLKAVINSEYLSDICSARCIGLDYSANFRCRDVEVVPARVSILFPAL